jgi:hypothetical protein
MNESRLPLPGEHSSPTGQSVRQPLPPSRLPLPRWYRRWRRRRLLTKLTRLSQKLPGGYR